MTDGCDHEITEAQSFITEQEEQLFTREEYRKHMAEVKSRPEDAVRDASKGMFTNEFVAQYIDKIFVTSIDNDAGKLEIQIFTGKNTEKRLKKLRTRYAGRAEVTSKKMIETYAKGMQ